MHQASVRSIIISEILDSRTKHLVSVSEISDYVLSNELVSMALAMVAEDKQINRVLEELFAAEVGQSESQVKFKPLKSTWLILLVASSRSYKKASIVYTVLSEMKTVHTCLA